MHGSIFIFGGTLQDRQDKALEIINKQIKTPYTIESIKKGLPDIKLIEQKEKKQSIGIEYTRELISFLSDTPFNLPKKFVLIIHAERLTTEAQNSILKTLEEPPKYAQIILMAKTQNALLDTIVSRCKKIEIADKNELVKDAETEGKISINTVLKLNPADRLKIAEDICNEEKSTIIKILEDWIKEIRNSMLTDLKDVDNNAHNIKLLMTIADDLAKINLNTRLALEYMLLSLK